MILRYALIALFGIGSALAQTPEGGWKVGEHYQVIEVPQPSKVQPGHVEVIEFFWLGCPHCYDLESRLKEWAKTRADYIDFRRVHIGWRPDVRAHARLFYSLLELGREDLVEAVFSAIHEQKNRLFIADNDEETLRVQAEFAKAHGIAADVFLATARSASIEARVAAAQKLALDCKISGVPAMTVNGKYRTAASLAGGQEEMLAVVDELAEREHVQLAHR